MPSYIDLAKLQPGDVVLAGGKGTTPKTIQAWTRSRYSHAAIVVTPMLWLESNPERGVHYSPQEIDSVRRQQGGIAALRRPLERANVYRARGLEAVDLDLRERIAAAIVVSAHDETLRNYPRNYDVVRKFLPWTPHRRDGGRRQPADRPDPLDGPFCSQLVVQILRTFLAGVGGERNADEVAPGHLATEGTLHRLDEAVLDSVPDGYVSRRPAEPLNGWWRWIPESEQWRRSIFRDSVRWATSWDLQTLAGQDPDGGEDDGASTSLAEDMEDLANSAKPTRLVLTALSMELGVLWKGFMAKAEEEYQRNARSV